MTLGILETVKQSVLLRLAEPRSGGGGTLRFDEVCNHGKESMSIENDRLMWQNYIYGMYWRHDGKVYYDEVPAESHAKAAEYFAEHKREDVTLVRIELVGAGEAGVLQPA